MICTYCDGTGEAEEWHGSPYMEDFTIVECAMCNGTGLNNLFRAIRAAEEELGCRKGELW